MIRTATALTLGATLAFAPAAFAGDKKVGDRPALTTESTEKLIEQRSKWGTKPVKTYKD
ncbi:MAG: hypothetical protein K0U74_14210 [Alphaproteobacteria bacterium]|nr:hypothetical protein [Alphaproteobacteria bacterium]